MEGKEIKSKCNAAKETTKTSVCENVTVLLLLWCWRCCEQKKAKRARSTRRILARSAVYLLAENAEATARQLMFGIAKGKVKWNERKEEVFGFRIVFSVLSKQCRLLVALRSANSENISHAQYVTHETNAYIQSILENRVNR